MCTKEELAREDGPNSVYSKSVIKLKSGADSFGLDVGQFWGFPCPPPQLRPCLQWL